MFPHIQPVAIIIFLQSLRTKSSYIFRFEISLIRRKSIGRCYCHGITAAGLLGNIYNFFY